MNSEFAVKNAIETINLIGEPKNEKDRWNIAQLYNMYYCGLAAALRSGALYKRESGKDGCPVLSIAVGGDVYTCRESILRDVLKDEYDQLSKYPYEDESYLFNRPYLAGGETIVREIKAEPVKKEEDPEKAAERAAEREVKKEEAIAETRKQAGKAALKEKNKQLKKAAKRFKYNPDYDHYHDDRMPEICRELDSRKRNTALRIALIAASCAGIVISLAVI